MKKTLKIILIIIIFLAGIWASYLAGYWLKAWFDSLKEQRIIKNAREELIALYNDEYGGKTPEETYEMFIAALRAGDIDLASKYFIFDKQEKKRQEFQAMKMKEELGEYINKLPKWGGLEEVVPFVQDGSVREFSYSAFSDEEVVDKRLGIEVRFPAGKYTAKTIFNLNSKNIWKISLL